MTPKFVLLNPSPLKIFRPVLTVLAEHRILDAIRSTVLLLDSLRVERLRGKRAEWIHERIKVEGLTYGGVSGSDGLSRQEGIFGSTSRCSKHQT